MLENNITNRKWPDRRRRHSHWRVTVRYADGDVFGRVYTDHQKAQQFATRQLRSPVVESTRVKLIS
jgi:hypothetical protein